VHGGGDKVVLPAYDVGIEEDAVPSSGSEEFDDILGFSVPSHPDDLEAHVRESGIAHITDAPAIKSEKAVGRHVFPIITFVHRLQLHFCTPNSNI